MNIEKYFTKLFSCWVLLCFYIFGTFLWGIDNIIRWLHHCSHTSLSRIVITGNRYFTTNNDIHRLIIKSGGLETFIEQDVNVIQSQIAQLPWINKVSIRKRWPDTLIINILEYVPLACWNKGFIISTTGIIFKIPKDLINNINDKIKKMPILFGPPNKEQDVLIKYLIFNEILKSVNFQIKSIKMDNRCAWQLMLNNNMYVKLGRKNIVERLCYFIKIYPILLQKIIEQNGHIDYIDLRYKSGFAIKWMNDPIVPILHNQ